MWVLNIYPNTRSNIVWAEKEEAVGSPSEGGLEEERGQTGTKEGGTRRKEEKIKVVNKMNEGVCLQTLKGPGRAMFRDSNGTQMRNQKAVLETSP